MARKQQSESKQKNTEGKKLSKGSTSKKQKSSKLELPDNIQKIKEKIQMKIEK